ncbi:MAG: FtsL-like putative cell division protein [Salibacteraceae bacterium]
MEQDVENIKLDKPKVTGVGRAFVGVMSGDIFGSEQLIKHLPYLGFLVLLGLVYIGIGYSAEDSVRQINKDKAELKEMRSEYITIKSDLMYATKQSELIKILHEKGLALEESFQPPKKIEVTENELEEYKNAANLGQ